MRSMFFGIDDDEYPKEWVAVNNEPTCTAYKEVKDDT